MAQHDFNIDNQSAPAFRGDLNNALEALGTLSSGATEPATTYANMLWYDTANNILKMRSEADDAWIDLGTLDQGANTFTPAGLTNLTQGQAEDDTSTVFGQVSGERLAQAIQTSRERGGAIVTTTSGTAFDFTGIPAEVQEIEVVLYDVGLSGSDDILIQLGTSGGVVTTGYVSAGGANFGTDFSAQVTSTAGFVLYRDNISGVVALRRLASGSNIWVSSHSSGNTTSRHGGGRVNLAAELTQVRITRTGTNTFNAGQLNVRWK